MPLKKNVLFVHAAGNEGANLERTQLMVITQRPVETTSELQINVITVGALDRNMVQNGSKLL